MTPRLHSARPIQRAVGFVDRPPRRAPNQLLDRKLSARQLVTGPSFRASARRCRLETEEGVRMTATTQKGLPRPPRSFQAPGRSHSWPAISNAAPLQETPFRSARLAPLAVPTCSFNSKTRGHLNPRRAQVVEPTTCAQSARRGPAPNSISFSAGWLVGMWPHFPPLPHYEKLREILPAVRHQPARPRSRVWQLNAYFIQRLLVRELFACTGLPWRARRNTLTASRSLKWFKTTAGPTTFERNLSPRGLTVQP